MSPSSGPYKAGDVLTCTSDGYPEPSYTWTDSDGKPVSTDRTITLSEGEFSLTCTATGNFTTPCSASNTVSGDAGKNIQHRDATESMSSVMLSDRLAFSLIPV